MKEEDALDDDSLELAGLAPMTIFEGILVSKLPSLVPERVLAVAPELKELEFASKEIDNVLPLFSKIGLLVSKKSNFISPFDSTEFKIPSLSRSRSILSIIPSLSE